jgi:hypothetical protein
MFNASADRLTGSFRRLSITLAAFVVMACYTAFAANNPVPFIDLPVVPAAVVPGGTGFTLTVNGAGFVSGSVVNWNGSPRATTFVSAGQITAAILASDIVTASTASITVSNPAPGGGTSNVAYFQVSSPLSTPQFTTIPQSNSNGLVRLVTGDFNGDGVLDVALVGGGPGASVLSVQLGNGDGTFKTPVTTKVNFPDDVIGVICADFNGDGKLDLALQIGLPFSIPYVMLGNGDGTFQPLLPGPDPLVEQAESMVAGDFNGDGIPDLVVGGIYFQSIGGTVFEPLILYVGNGDGTFQPGVTVPIGIVSATNMTVGDFNGDGKLDIVFAGGIALGNGDGTFQPVQTFPFNEQIQTQLIAADVNGDGKLDLLFGTAVLGVGVMLGNGDGSFQAVTNYPTDSQGFNTVGALTVADLNSDGKLDLLVGNAQGNQIPPLVILLGNGDGSFQLPIALSIQGFTYGSAFAVGDFNNDGKMDFVGSSALYLQGQFTIATVVPSSLSFGSQTVGTTSASQTVTLSNTGALTLTLSPVSVSGTNASEFPETNTCPASLAPAGVCQIKVTFAPTAAGTQSATLNLPNNGIGTHAVPLGGSGDTTPPTIILSATALNFGALSVGTTTSQEVLLTNPGPGTVTTPVNSLSGANASDFSESNTCNSELLSGASCTVTVKFTPAAMGSRSATLKISDNAAGSPQNVSLTGSGPDFSTTAPNPPSLTVAAGQTANYTFGVQPLGGFNQTVTLTCSGAPAGAKCMLPASVTLSGSSNANVAVTVTTTAHTSTMSRSMSSKNAGWLACGLFGLPLIMSMARVGVRRRRVHIYRWTFLLLMAAAMLLVPACGGGGGGSGSGAGTPAGTYLLTVRGTFTSAGTTLLHDTTFTLVVE